MKNPTVNLGQSQFQDTYFVAGAQLTPYRRLRQIDLELRGIEDALKRGSIALRRLELKISKLDPSDPEQALDIEETEWDLMQQAQLVADAESRKANFLFMREQLIEDVPAEYWNQGYENAEQMHWVLHYSRQLALENLTSQRPSVQLMQQIMLLPDEAQRQVAQLGSEQFARLGGVQTVDTQVLPDNEPNND